MADAQDRGWGPPCPEGSIVSIRAGDVDWAFRVHERVAGIFTAFINELVERPPGYSLRNRPYQDDWSYSCRHIDNDPSKPWSNHAWGLAIDINAEDNPQMAPLTTNMPSWVRQAQPLMDKYGLRWGGTFSDEPDPMHFEFMLTPADADRISAGLGGLSMADAQDILDRLQALRDELKMGKPDGIPNDFVSLAGIRTRLIDLQEQVTKLQQTVNTLTGSHPHD
jgi:D-alanyl-D-alanine carboxypeptidase